MRHSSSPRIWISVVALTIFILAGSASLSAQGTRPTGGDIQFHKFVPIVPPENSKFAATSSDPAQINSVIAQQVQLLMQEKASRTPAQQKIDSNVLYTIRMMRGQEAAPGVTSLYTGVDLDQNNRIVVDIVATVSDQLLQQLEAAGALVLDSHKDYRAIRAIVPADQIEIIAASPDVTFIGRKAESIVSRIKLPAPGHASVKGTLAPGFDIRAARVRKQIADYLQQRAGTNSTPGTVLTGSGSVDTEGDAAHLAARARGIYGVTGAGLKIGVLSDSANATGAATAAQATGDLPPTCPGPGGSCLTIVHDFGGGSDEGAAMLEIVHDLVPGATLFFATADPTESAFATNIQNLRTVSGCDIIVDDVFYFDESPFQDGIVAQAVTTVTGLGAMYFSSAGNEGSVAAGTSGYFEGDFNDSGSAAFTFPGGAKTGTIHNFGTVAIPVNGDIITSSGEAYTLNWADPQAGSTNDYDLFIVTSSGTIKAQSTNIQTGTQNPFEQITTPALAAGDRLVVFKVAGAASVAFAINTLRGTLTNVTTGQTHGHSAVAGAFSVAATPAAAAFNGVAPVGPFPNAFTTSNSAEPFSSDGPRRQFFTPTGTPITAGQFTFASGGGTLIAKPDITAADGVTTTLPSGSGLNPFYGTSAAAPHAASIAALILSAKPSLTPAQIRTTLTSTALDIGPAGVDNVSGSGIVMALAALNSLGISPGADPEIGAVTASENPGNSNGIIEAGEGASLVIQLKNQFGVVNATGITAALTTTTPGVTITQPGTSAYADLTAGTGVGNNLSPFTFTVASNAACGLNIEFTLTVTFTGGSGATTRALNFSVQTGVLTISNTLGGATPTGMPAGMTFTTGTQTGRLVRTLTTSVCGTLKANPLLTTAVGSRTFDAYTLTPNTSACMNVALNSASGLNLFHVAYNSGGFVPANPSTNYLADPGNNGISESYGLSANSGTGITFVVHELNPGGGIGSPYTLSIPSCVVVPAGVVNHPPTAVAQNVTVTAATIGGTAAANINNGSSDPDPGDTITLTQTPPGPYPVGVTSVILTVTDSKGAKAQASANVTVVNPPAAPTVTTILPTTTPAGSPQFTLTVNGTNFVATSVVNFNGVAKTTAFVSANQLTATILAADVVAAGTPGVTVFTPAPGGGTSNSVTFTITAGSNPVPAITNIAPISAAAGSAAFTLTVNGSNFVATSVVNFNGFAKSTAFVNANQLTASILAGDIAIGGFDPVTVTNPTPGGGTSNAVNFGVNNPVAAITTISPTNALLGSAAFTLTLTGSNFVSSSVVNFNGSPRATSFQSATQVSATILSTDLLAAGTFPISVTNPTPAGGTSNSVTFTVNNPLPTVTTLAPTGTAAGSAGFTLTVNGTNFVSGAFINFAGTNRLTTFVSSTQLTAAILAADVATAGTPAVLVNNPTPGGGASNSINFNVTAAANPVPTVTTISPTSIAVGTSAFTLTVNGTNFVSNSVIHFGAQVQATTFVSSTQLTTTIQSLEVSTAGTPAVTVVNPTPGGGTSNSVTFNITAAAVPDMTIAVSHVGSFTQGQVGATYSITATNSGTGSTAGTVVVNDILPGPLTATNMAGTGWACTVATQTCTRSDVLAAATPYPVITLTVNVSASAPASVGNSVAVSGGGETNLANDSATDTTTINASSNPVPAITTLVPNTVSAGSGGFTLTVNGSNFISSSVVQWNGSPRTTTFVNATQLTAAITAADVLTANLDLVSVFNPTPGGGTSLGVTFTVSTPIPALATLVPSSAIAGGAAFTLTVNGGNFINTSVVQWNGSNRATTFVSATQLTAAITAADIATVGTSSVKVFTPTVVFGGAQPLGVPTGTTSNALTFTINASNPAPTLTLLSPNTASAGSGAFTLTLTGTNFINGSVVNWSGSPRTTTFVSATQLTAAITAADVSTVNVVNVNVSNPTPGGGTSVNLPFTITTPVPAITSLVPNSAFAGGAAFTMLVNGSNFINTSVVQWNGGNRATTFVSSTQLSAAVTAADILSVGTASVKVFTPTVVIGGITSGGPSGVFSNALTFTINAANPVPTLTSIAPTSIGAGGAAFTMTLNGTNFISTSVAQWKGSPRTTTFVSATQLTAAIIAADIAASGTAAINVVNPAPGGGTTNSLTFTITDFSVTSPTPPQTVTAGQSASFSIATAPVGGAFAGNVTFTTSALPQGAAASFNPTSVAPGSSSTMTVTTTVRGSAQTTRPPFSPSGPVRPLWLIAFTLTLALASLTLAKFGRQRMRRLIPIGAFALLLISAGYLSGCAGSGFPKVGSPTGTPAGTYPITVTGTSGTVQHSVTVTLIVQ